MVLENIACAIKKKVKNFKHLKWHVAKYGDQYSEFVLCI